MKTELERQLLQLAAAVLTGAVLGVLYDGFHIFSRRLPAPAVFLTDLFYLLLAGAGMFLSAQEAFGGVTVLYLLLCGSGVGLYVGTLHRPMEKCFSSAERTLAALTRKGRNFLVRTAKTLKKVGKNVKKSLCKRSFFV